MVVPSSSAARAAGSHRLEAWPQQRDIGGITGIDGAFDVACRVEAGAGW